ncbi:MAG TPA: PaaI family thioesterase [Anaerolineaceae bacterium]|nr:PaaI family thioesterase [Anaerolineaceae bacterium]
MKKQPSSSTCFVCGVENPAGLHLSFVEETPGEVIAETRVSAEYNSYPGVVHGGIVAAMLDEVAGRAFMMGEPPRFMYTAKLEIRYRKPVPVQEKLIIKGHAVKDRGTIAEAKSEIYLADGTLLAEATGVYVNIPEETFANVDLEALGWKVYPDEEEKA